MEKQILFDLRKDYKLKSLDVDSLASNPFEQFKLWFNEAVECELPEPNAMTLATATRDGKPSARIVLLKEYDERGFVFYTNYNGRKGEEISENPEVALLFTWLELERQIRIEGTIGRIDPAASDAYFQTRPRLSQIAAVASPQSYTVKDRAELEAKFAALAVQYEGKQIPRPANWGGYRVNPEVFEFWQGRRNRLHDRIRFKQMMIGEWRIERLAP